jgi:soluble cytochrome b562
MRRFVYYILFLALAATFSAAKDETVDDLKSHFTNARPEDRAELGIRIAQHQLRNADKLYNEGKIEQARAAVEDIADYTEKAGEAATQTQRRLKNVEIDARKMADKLRDIKRTLSFEDQPPVDQAIKRLEDVRTDLLKEMFKKKERR